MEKAVIYVHGKNGDCSEAEQYKKNCIGFDIVGVDYNDYFPWIVQTHIETVYKRISKECKHIFLIANSIGAYFAMHTLQNYSIEKALFISPILNMERLILDMMQSANVTEKELYEKGEIAIEFGENLSWKYLDFVRKNPIKWNIPTEILYAGNDNLTSRTIVDEFVSSHQANLTVMEDGEHWFHTDTQTAFLDEWMKQSFR